MKTTTQPTHVIRIYLSGPIEVAKQVIREYAYDNHICVTIETTTFIYVGGEETGYVVGLVNYPRFPSTKEDLALKAHQLATTLILRTHQHSALVVEDDKTTWITRRED